MDVNYVLVIQSAKFKRKHLCELSIRLRLDSAGNMSVETEFEGLFNS